MPARRAVLRWATRLFRREWRQQALVVCLLTVAVAAAIGFGSATYNTVGVPENAIFGSANHRYEVDAPDPEALVVGVAAATQQFGVVDVIARWTRPVPGSVDSIEFVAQDPAGPFSGPMLALRNGRFPVGSGEIAVTDGVAKTLQLDIGGTLALDGPERTVVGVVENPSDLNAEFALVAPGVQEQLESAVVLVGGSGNFDEVRELREFGSEHLSNADLTSRGDIENAQAAAMVLGIAALAMVLVSLVAAAGFVAVAQRRLRQLGMFGAIGATERELRLVVVANGAVIGFVSAFAGAVVGLLAWVAVAPRLEHSVGHRIDPLNVPGWVIGTAMVLVIVTATAAAWWPARAVARISITSALSGRPPRPRPAHHTAALAVLLTATGVACLVIADRTRAPFVVVGTVATVAGVLLLSPLAIQLLGTAARWLPVAMRLALRDLSRFRARSGMALAAISLTLGVPVAVVVVANAAENSSNAANVSERQLLVWTRDPAQPEGVSPLYTQDPSDSGFSPYLPRLTAAELDALAAQVDRIAAPIEGSTVAPLELARDPGLDVTPDGPLAVTLAQPTEIGYLDVAPLFVATPELLAHYGRDFASLDPGTEILTVTPDERLPDDARQLLQSDELWLGNVADPLTDATVQPATNIESLTPSYTSLPGSFVTPDALRERGWESTRVGWLIETTAPLTSGQVAAAREVAAEAGLLVEAGRDEPSLVALRWGATAVGMLLALGVLAMTVGLIRTEGARDLRTLAATGATRTIRRALTAVTAGGLALLGALLGTAGAYLGLAAALSDDIGSLAPVPTLQLLVIVAGVPALAAAAGWTFARREPPNLSRQPIE